jgi:dCMP deaminase
MFMMIARAAAMRSTCFRLNVGAVVVVNDRPVSIGYNGAPAGHPHCTGNACPGREFCRQTIHAEANALKYVPEFLYDMDLGERSWDLYVTHSPCDSCMQEIIDGANVKRVFFETPYRKTEHLKLIPVTYDVKIYQVTPAGYVIDWNTQDVVEMP